jgi:hypothetical protein
MTLRRQTAAKDQANNPAITMTAAPNFPSPPSPSALAAAVLNSNI